MKPINALYFLLSFIVGGIIALWLYLFLAMNEIRNNKNVLRVIYYEKDGTKSSSLTTRSYIVIDSLTNVDSLKIEIK